MSWGKIDDQFHAHKKAKRAWKASRASLGLHLLAISYCAGHLTDGLVDHEFVEEKLPVARERNQATGALVDDGLWVPEDDGWRINDWLEYNPSRAEVLDKRRRDSERKARGFREDSTRNPDGIQTESRRNPSASRARARARVPAVPDPTPTPPQPPASGGRKRARENWERQMYSFTAEHFAPGTPPGLVAQQADVLRRSGHEPTVEALRPLVERWHPSVEDAA